MSIPSENTYPTSLGTSSAEEIRLLGHNLAEDLLGKVGFAELAFWMVAMRRPDPSEVRVFESVLVALADHGFTPTAIAARLTYLSAPDSLQGAIAAGLLGGGSRFLGVTEESGKLLTEVVDKRFRQTGRELPVDPAGWDDVARDVITGCHDARQKVPGLGHPIHKKLDPRTAALMRIARQEGTFGPHLELFDAIGRMSQPVLGKSLPLNGAGVCGAVLVDLGLPAEMLRGFALLARCAGLLGQLAEEQRRPIARRMYDSIDRAAEYVEPHEGQYSGQM